MIREIGLPYRKIEELGLLLPVIDLDMKFIKPAHYDDLIRISTRIIEYSNIRITFEVRIERLADRTERSGELLVTGHTKHVWLNRDWKPTRIDRAAPDLHALIEQACQDEADD